MGRISVLHVEDNPRFRDLVGEFLEREDRRLEVVSEPSADDGLSRLEGTEHVDCIVSDYDMPGMNGLEFLDAVRDRNEKIPFILYTGKGSEAVASKAISKGATDYLQKGGGTEQYELLANRIRNAVAQHRSQRRAEEHERITQVVRNLNRALIRAESTDEIETRVCEILSDAEPYLTACIAGVDTDAMQIAPRIWAGDAAGYFDELEMAVDDGSPGRRAPGGRAFHEREIAVSQNISEDERYERWREAATDRGFRSLAVVPLEYDGDLYGLLAVFADRPFAFDDTERDLLSELGEDIAHAMYARELQTELRTTASRLEVLFERSPDMIKVHNMEGDLLDPNPKLCEKTGYSAAELTEMKVWELHRAIEPDEAMALWEGMDVGDSHRLTGEYRRADGSTFPVEVHIRRLDLAGDDQFIAISRDISERRQRERELKRYEQITENLPVGVFRTTYDGDIVSANAQFVSLYGGDSRADFGNVSAWDLWADSDDREKLLERLERDGVVEDLQIRAETLDGDQFWAETTMRLTAADGDRYIDGVVQDVTEQRERTRRLEQAETLFQNTKDALFLVDVGEEFVVERVNPAYETATGLPTDEVCGRTPGEIVGDERGAEIERRYRECVDRAEPLEYEEELVIDGERTHWETRIAPVVVDGTVEKLVGATRNITDQREQKQTLRRSERRYEAILEDPNILAGVLDTDGRLREVNSTAMEYVDATSSELLGEPIWATPWWSEEQRPAIRANVEDAAGGEYVGYEADLTGPDGEPYSVAGVIRPVTDEDGQVVSLIISARDITERRERERSLGRYETIIETMDDVAFVVNEDWTVTFVNRSIQAYVDGSRDDLEGQPVTVLADEYAADGENPDRFEATLERAFRGERPEPLELTLAVGGSEVVFEYRLSPLDTEDPSAVVIVMRDITRRKRRERALERQNERFDELASAVSHDLQTPLATARGRAELAVETGDTEHAADALAALERADDLREGLVEMLRSREIVQRTEAVDIGAAAEEVWEAVRPPTDTSLRVLDPPRVRGDPAAVRRLLENLLSNAVEHGQQNVTVQLGGLADGFYVSDDGPGIPPSDRDDVFTPGFSTKAEGSGVGLASVREIVVAHDWTIDITEPADGGTQFEIRGVESTTEERHAP